MRERKGSAVRPCVAHRYGAFLGQCEALLLPVCMAPSSDFHQTLVPGVTKVCRISQQAAMSAELSLVQEAAVCVGRYNAEQAATFDVQGRQ